MIKRIRITNFKSLQDVAVELAPVTILIGRSGSGKSNFVEAIRWLRDYLTLRNEQTLQQGRGNWQTIMSATATRPMAVTFSLIFDAPSLAEDFQFELRFQQLNEQDIPRLLEEKLCLGKKTLYHQRERKWIQPPTLVVPPPPGQLMLGALTGVQEVNIAHLVLTNGIGCYAFSDRVLAAANPGSVSPETGFRDNGDNFLEAFVSINTNLATWHSVRDMAAALRRLKPSLKSIDLQQPSRDRIVVSLESDGRLLVFDLWQESEGFRRLLACLIALYQFPPKQTLVFDEPEKGIYPLGLSLLADEFKGFASKGRGQILVTTHSPEFLNQFAPEQIRVVEMRNFVTQIGPVAPEQLEGLREHFLKPGELLTVDEGRLEGSLVGAE